MGATYNGDVDATQIASMFNVLRPDKLAIDTWIGALKSGDFKFGYGCLRDGENCYDPFGVLAALNLVDWSWDNEAGIWAIDGQTEFLGGVTLMRFLGCPSPVDNGYGARLAERLGEINDSATDFGPVIDVLGSASKLSEQQRSDHRLSLEQTQSLRRPVMGGERADFVDFGRGGFYGRR